MEPCDEIIKQIKEAYILTKGKLVVNSIRVQKQRTVECGAFSVANLWNVLSGGEPRTTRFYEKTIRAELYESF